MEEKNVKFNRFSIAAIGCADANLVERISRLKETRKVDGFENDFDVPLEFTSDRDG